MDVEQLVHELIPDEGIRLKPYKDTKRKLTIGIGRNLDDVGISMDEALTLVHNDIARAAKLLDEHFPWWRTLTDDRQRVLANMAFNLGGRLLEFQNTMGEIQAGQYEAAAARMQASLWARQVGPRAVRLAERMKGDK